MSRRRDRARALEPGDVARESRGSARSSAQRKRTRPGGRAPARLRIWVRTLRRRLGSWFGCAEASSPICLAASFLAAGEEPVSSRRRSLSSLLPPPSSAMIAREGLMKRKGKSRRFSSSRKKMSRFRANLHSCARGAWRIGPRTAMPMDDTAGRVPPRRVGDPTGGAGGRGRGAAPGPSRPSRPTPVGSCASSSVPRRRAPSAAEPVRPHTRARMLTDTLVGGTV